MPSASANGEAKKQIAVRRGLDQFQSVVDERDQLMQDVENLRVENNGLKVAIYSLQVQNVAMTSVINAAQTERDKVITERDKVKAVLASIEAALGTSTTVLGTSEEY